jgi:hypothetical protein
MRFPAQLRSRAQPTLSKAPIAVQAGLHREHDKRADEGESRATRSSALSPAVAVVAVVLVVAGLAWCYFRVSWTVAPNSDGPANALQAQDLLRGNLLLRGWTLTDVSFYTTELWEYAAIEVVRSVGRSLSVGMGVVHTAAAVTYALLVLLAGLLARGRARSGQGLARALVAVGIMVAPQLGYGAFVLLLSPDHVGTEVPLLLGWLVLDRAPRRWYVVGFTGLLLAWVQVADRGAVLAAVLPLAVVCVVRAAAGWRRAGAWFEASLAAVAVASVVVAWAVARLIRVNQGYVQYPLPADRSALSLLPVHLKLTALGVAQLYGADFAGISGAPAIFFAAVHCAGLAVAVVSFAVALARLRRLDLVGQVLVVAIACTVAAYALSNTPGVVFGTGYGTREMAAVLPLGAALAGRMTGPLLLGRVRQAAAAAVLACYVAALLYSAAQPAVQGPQAGLAQWLLSRHLTTGLATRNSQLMTVESGERLDLLVSYAPGGKVRGVLYESKASDYDPRTHYADFVVAEVPLGARPVSSDEISVAETLATFGRPAREYYYGGYTILVYRQNLLNQLPPPQPRGSINTPGRCRIVSLLTCWEDAGS